jgi:H+/gluconate symporter-like permease
MPGDRSLNGMLIGVARIVFFVAVVALLSLWAAIARRR